MRDVVLHNVFLDLQKEYGARYMYMCINILAGHSVGPSLLWLLWKYWGCLKMETKAGGVLCPPHPPLQWIWKCNPCITPVPNYL